MTRTAKLCVFCVIAGRETCRITRKRGQAFLRELLAALDAMPEKKLIKGALREPTGEVCAIGCVGKARGLNMASFDVYDYESIAAALNINEKLIQEIEWINDENYHPSPEQRWKDVREWAVEHLRPAPGSEAPVKLFKVATFADERGRISCYTLWYNSQWPGCIEYEVGATNGAEAKKKARALRKSHEGQEYTK